MADDESKGASAAAGINSQAYDKFVAALKGKVVPFLPTVVLRLGEGLSGVDVIKSRVRGVGHVRRLETDREAEGLIRMTLG